MILKKDEIKDGRKETGRSASPGVISGRISLLSFPFSSFCFAYSSKICTYTINLYTVYWSGQDSLCFIVLTNDTKISYTQNFISCYPCGCCSFRHLFRQYCWTDSLHV